MELMRVEYLEIALIAFFIDMLHGEILTPHPVAVLGVYIEQFEKRFYDNTIYMGGVLTLITVVASALFAVSMQMGLMLLNYDKVIPYVDLGTILLGIFASSVLSGKMLYDSVKGVLEAPHTIKDLVSRDTENLSRSEINKAAIETYAENLNDGLVAPLFYLVIFGFVGAVVYKSVNTLDSMVGYRNERYEKFGKVSAILDDILNFIPSRITALLITFISLDW